MARGYLRSIALCSLAAAPLTVLICHAAEGLIVLLLGRQWIAAIDPTAILSLTLVLVLGGRVATAVFMALGRAERTHRPPKRLCNSDDRGFGHRQPMGPRRRVRRGPCHLCVQLHIGDPSVQQTAGHRSDHICESGTCQLCCWPCPSWRSSSSARRSIWHAAPTMLKFPIEAAATGAVIYGACMVKPAWFLGPDGIWLVQEVRGHVPARFARTDPAHPVLTCLGTVRPARR